jgi:hypothetical protein
VQEKGWESHSIGSKRTASGSKRTCEESTRSILTSRSST